MILLLQLFRFERGKKQFVTLCRIIREIKAHILELDNKSKLEWSLAPRFSNNMEEFAAAFIQKKKTFLKFLSPNRALGFLGCLLPEYQLDATLLTFSRSS